MLAGFLEGLRGLVAGPSLPPAERRSTPRLRCYYPVSCRVGADQICNARVTEMSRQGMRMEIAEAFKRGMPLRITYTSPHPADTVQCKVMWTRKRPSGSYSMGVAYAETPPVLDASWVGFVLHELGFDESDVYEKRRTIRFPTLQEAQLLQADGQPATGAQLINLGVGGALLGLPRPVPKHTDYQLQFTPRLTLPARLVLLRPHPDRHHTHLAHLRFHELTKTQTRLLGQHLIGLLRAAHT